MTSTRSLCAWSVTMVTIFLPIQSPVTATEKGATANTASILPSTLDKRTSKLVINSVNTCGCCATMHLSFCCNQCHLRRGMFFKANQDENLTTGKNDSPEEPKQPEKYNAPKGENNEILTMAAEGPVTKLVHRLISKPSMTCDCCSKQSDPNHVCCELCAVADASRKRRVTNLIWSSQHYCHYIENPWVDALSRKCAQLSLLV